MKTKLASNQKTKNKKSESWIKLFLIWIISFTSLVVLSRGESSDIQFVNFIPQNGISFTHDNAATADKYLIETIGGGCGWIDYNSDGLLDPYFTQSTETPLYKPTKPLRAALYQNNGDNTFSEVTKKAGVEAEGLFGTGVAVADYNNDGFSDLYVIGWDKSILYRNNGDGTFKDVTTKAGVANRGKWGSSGAFFDYDKDGNLDLMIVNYVSWAPENNRYCGEKKTGYRAYCHPDEYEGQIPTLYRNNGDGTFKDVTRQAGMDGEPGKGLGIVAADFNNDGWTDIFQANDSMRNFLFLNNQDGTFRDSTISAGVGYSEDGLAEAGMGTDAADYDGDGWMDIYVTHLDFERDRLYRNNKDETFEDSTYSSGIEQHVIPYSGFGIRFVDYDNDGKKDLFVANGHILDNIHLYHENVTYAESNLMFRNVGKGRFSNISETLGPDFLTPKVSRAAALADYDNDGDMDILVCNNGQEPQMLRNDGGNKNNWLEVLLRGTKSNRDGIGARLKITAGDLVQFMDAKGGTSFQSAHDARVHIGLGKHKKVDYIETTWPSGMVTRIKNVESNQIITLEEGQVLINRTFQ